MRVYHNFIDAVKCCLKVLVVGIYTMMSQPEFVECGIKSIKGGAILTVSLWQQ